MFQKISLAAWSVRSNLGGAVASMLVPVCWCLQMMIPVCWCLQMMIPVCWCLRVLDGGGPGGRLVYAELGQELSLSCAYDLEEDTLHSIKWYRDDKEFYRYLPRGESDTEIRRTILQPE